MSKSASPFIPQVRQRYCSERCREAWFACLLVEVLSAGRYTDILPYPSQSFCLVVSTQYRESFGMSCHKGTLRP